MGLRLRFLGLGVRVWGLLKAGKSYVGVAVFCMERPQPGSGFIVQDLVFMPAKAIFLARLTEPPPHS